ncbi:MAG TPA: glycosyltransferase family 39 protein [Bryobacteraceae bacterium]|nr:glycosyltransferase family 39 protein [Bryobacteraceae bacterium]
MGHPGGPGGGNTARDTQRRFRHELIVVLVAAAVFFGCAISPPSLMDDVDAVQAQIARNMLDSGDWVTARLDGVAYLEKSQLKYWTMAVSYMVFGVHDWAARIPMALFAVALCWLTARIGWWAFGGRAGLYAGLSLATCVGLFLFTRILLPDVALTFTITLAMWALLRALEVDEPHPRRWAWVLAASIACGLLLKGLIAAVFPVGAGLTYLFLTSQLLRRRTWKRLRPLSGALLIFLIAAPWHVLATIRNPPYFYWSMRSMPGEYHGFFWFYFINEHVLRFLNLRYPRDYNTVPRVYFWLFHLLWLFPWSAYLAAAFRLNYRPIDRAGRMRLLALCWTGFVLVFFTFSSTQEYYSMPCYPALALLIGCALTGDKWIRAGHWVISAIAGVAALAIAVILVQVWNAPTPGDISAALTQHPEAYTLSLGHMGDLTLQSFAYLRLPLIVAGIAFLIGASAVWWRQPIVAFVLMMLLFLHAARIAMVVFDPYLSSRPLATALLKAPPGQLIEDNAYYTFSSVFFYTNRRGLLLNGRQTNLEYGSYAPDAPNVFLDDPHFARLWRRPERYYLLVEGPSVPRIEKLVGRPDLHVVAESGGKFLLTNHANSD